MVFMHTAAEKRSGQKKLTAECHHPMLTVILDSVLLLPVLCDSGVGFRDVTAQL